MDNRIDNGISKKIDLLDTAILTMFFILIVTFSYGGLSKNSINIFMILCLMVGMLIGYYANITVAILYSIIFDFIYSSTHIFLNIARGIPISAEVYFWIIIVPIFTVVSAYKGKLIKEIQHENRDLKGENKELVMIDKETGLRSTQTFFSEMQSYMNISDRYGIDLYLMLIKIKYQNEVVNILGKNKYNKIVNQLSQSIDSSLRQEDKKYILRDMNLFGIIFFSNEDGGRRVKNRVKEIIENIEFKEDASMNKIKLEVLVGVKEYDGNIINNPYEFFKMAEKDMEYDV